MSYVPILVDMQNELGIDYNHPFFELERLLDYKFGFCYNPDYKYLSQTRIHRIMSSAFGTNDLNSRVLASRPTVDNDGFKVFMEVGFYKPSELKVKISGDTIIVEGKHDEREDRLGFIKRDFVRKYQLPNNCDAEKIEYGLTFGGILTIKAPLKTPPAALTEIEQADSKITPNNIAEEPTGMIVDKCIDENEFKDMCPLSKEMYEKLSLEEKKETFYNHLNACNAPHPVYRCARNNDY